MLKKISSLFLFLLLGSLHLHASSSITLMDTSRTIVIDSSFFETIDTNGQVVVNQSLYFFTPHPNKFFKYRFTIENKSNQILNRVIVSYNYTIDEFRFFYNYSNHVRDTLVFQNSKSLGERYVFHKQPVVPITLDPGEKVEIEIWLKNESAYQYSFAIYSYPDFFNHFMMENLYFGIFYGVMVFILLFSIFYAVYFQDKVIWFYFLFALSQIIHMMFRDGTGLYLIHENPHWAEYLKSLSRVLFSVFLLFYTKSFLGIKYGSKLCKIIYSIIGIRILYTIIMPLDHTNITFHMEMVIILFCTVLSIRSYFRFGRDTIYMSIGLAALTITYFVYYFSVLFMPSWSKVGFFLFYYGVALESILMTLALIEHFKQIQVTAMRRDEVNVVLEQKVEERTEELNMFLYSASHDLRGPLKSIEGLCKLAQVDDSIPRDQVLTMLLKKVASLENYVNDLNAVTKIKSNTAQIKIIDFEAIHQQLVEQFSSYDRIGQMDIQLKVLPTGVPFYFDEFSLRIIYQNILENAIKYSDKNKPMSFLHITVQTTAEKATITFEDNGIGIPENILPKIFAMFYRGNENSKDDTGLGLYIVKLIIHKWKGQIDVASQAKEGTTFTIELPNKKK